VIRHICFPLLALGVIAGCGPQAGPVNKGPEAAQGQVAQGPTVGASEAGDKTPTLEREKVLLGAPELLAGIPGDGPLTIAQIQAWLDTPANHAALDIEFPQWLEPGRSQAKDLKDNPMTRAKIELGRQLFFDKRLSADNTVSCASCHEPEKGYTVSTPLAEGIGGQLGKRNPSTLLNRVMLALGHDQQFWDGRSTSVEDALLHALEDKTEMAAAPEETISKVKGIEGYRLQFERIYGDVTWEGTGDAIGCFVRCLVTGSSPYDYAVAWEMRKNIDQEFLDDDPELAAAYEKAKAGAEAYPMSESAKRGEYSFFGNKAWCSACHNGVNFTDELYHNVGIGLEATEPDLGRYAITKKAEDWGAFKTPSIRAAVWTAPYMHDGSLATLEDVIEWYAHEGLANRNLDYRFKRIERQELSTQDKQDLVEFVKACSGPLPQVETQRLPE
jgi:cytochrome c peroxidase